MMILVSLLLIYVYQSTVRQYPDTTVNAPQDLREKTARFLIVHESLPTNNAPIHTQHAMLEAESTPQSDRSFFSLL